MDSNAVEESLRATRRHCMSRIVECLEHRSLQAAHGVDVLAECGPFLRQLLLAAEEAHVRNHLDGVFERVYEMFAPLLRMDGDAGDSVRASVVDAATRASRVVATEALQPCGLTTSSSLPPPPPSSSISPTAQHAAWCRIGQLVLRLTQESTSSGRQPGVNPKCTSTAQQASIMLLLRQVSWVCETNDERNQHNSAACEDRAEGRVGGVSPTVSGFTVVWDAVLTFLHLLAADVGLAGVVGGTDGDCAAPLAMEGQHPLLQIIADCIIFMTSRNHSLLQEIHNAHQAGEAAENLRVAANNFAWLQQYCRRLPMANAVEVEELLTQCTAAVLQDIVTDCVTELQNILPTYIEPSGRSPGVTRSLLAARLAAICGFCNSLVSLLPRRAVLSLVLEQSLQPMMAQLLDEEDRHEKNRSGNRAGVARRVERFFLPTEAPAVSQATARDVCLSGDAIVLAQRLSEMLSLLEEDAAFGVLCCQQSPSFCSMRHLLSRIGS